MHFRTWRLKLVSLIAIASHSPPYVRCHLQRIIEEVGCQTREYEWPDYWYFGEERLLIKDAEEVTLWR